MLIGTNDNFIIWNEESRTIKSMDKRCELHLIDQDQICYATVCEIGYIDQDGDIVPIDHMHIMPPEVNDDNREEAIEQIQEFIRRNDFYF